MIKSDLWLTPNTPKHPIIDLTLAVLGEIDLDPCSNSGAPNVPAKYHYTAPNLNPHISGGIALPWGGKVFVHPPHTKSRDWLEKFCHSYARGEISAGIALVKSAAIQSAGTGRVIREGAGAVCFWGASMAPPIQFLDPETRQPANTKHDCALIYCGPDVTTFSAVFSGYGAVMQTIN